MNGSLVSKMPRLININKLRWGGRGGGCNAVSRRMCNVRNDSVFSDNLFEEQLPAPVKLYVITANWKSTLSRDGQKASYLIIPALITLSGSR